MQTQGAADPNDSKQVYHPSCQNQNEEEEGRRLTRNENDKSRKSLVSNHMNDTYYSKGCKNNILTGKLSIPSIMSNSR